MELYKKLGQRVKELREKASLSQEELAKKLAISRSAVSQIENGERKLAADELLEVSKLFHVPLESLLATGNMPEVVFCEEKPEENSQKAVRINVPQRNLKKFKQVLLYILNKVGSKPNIGETVIYKLLYFIDFNYYEKYEEQLIGATYLKNHFGPTPTEFAKVKDQMIKEGEMEVVKSEYFSFPQTKYLPRQSPNLSLLKANELEVIDDVLAKLSDMSAKQISDYSHNDIPWATAKDGEKIEYESGFYRTQPYSVRKYDADEDEQ